MTQITLHITLQCATMELIGWIAFSLDIFDGSNKVSY